MGAGLFFLVLLAIVAVVLLLAIGLPAVVAYLRDRDSNLRAKYLTERKNKNILYKAHREIMNAQGDGAALISEIAVNEVDSNEIRELN